MSLSDIVDERYRLHAADLDGLPIAAVISNVTYQGVEELSPVLHLEGFQKRLVLSKAQSQDLMRITGSAIFSDWIGQRIELRPIKAGRESFIAIRPFRRRRFYLRSPGYWLRGERGGWLLAITIVLLISLASALAIYYNGDALLQTLDKIKIPSLQ